jgi:hypothetical protein
MIKNCSLYLPVDKPALKSLYPNGKTDGSLFKAATWFEYESAVGPVRLTLQHEDLARHLQGFAAFVAQLPNRGKSRAEAQSLIKATKAAIGVTLPGPVELESVVIQSVMHIARQFGGFMFIADSIMLPDGRFLVGPMAQDEESDVDAVPERRKVDPENYKHQGNVEGVDPARVAQRERIYRLLAERGFRCARSLPLYRSDDGLDRLRPIEQIAARLLALNAVFLWVSAPEDVAPAGRVQAFVERNALHAHLTEDERAMLALPRAEANAAHANTIGWRLENMWALAWILGFEPAPPFFQGQIPGEITRKMIVEFLPHLDAANDQFLSTVHPRTAHQVGELEDLYYCTHNAVRSAQMGGDSIPQYFHPVRDGGAIHERRHALTWAMSPGVEWDDTDLST